MVRCTTKQRLFARIPKICVYSMPKTCIVLIIRVHSANKREGASSSEFWSGRPNGAIWWQLKAVFSLSSTSLWPAARFFFTTSKKSNQICVLWTSLLVSAVQWRRLIARYQEMGSRTDPWRIQDLAPQEQIHPAASLDGNDRLGGVPINIPAFSLCPTLKPCVGGWSDPPPPLPPPPLTACRESVEGWWCPDYIRQMIPSFSHTRHS